jgi:hypothetical protein
MRTRSPNPTGSVAWRAPKPYARDMAFELPAYTVAVIEIRAN